MEPDQVAGQGQADAQAAGGPRQPLVALGEHLEHAREHRRLQSDPRVADPHDRLAVLPADESAIRPPGSVNLTALESNATIACSSRTGSADIAIGSGSAAIVSAWPALLQHGADRLDGPGDDLPQVDWGLVQLDPVQGHARDVQQVIHDPLEVLDLALDHVAGLDDDGVVRPDPRAEQVDRGQDRGQGVAQLVREHRQELVAAAVGGHQLLGAGPQPLLHQLALGQVAHHLDESAIRAVLVADTHEHPAAPEPGTVLPHVPAVVRGAAALQCLGHLPIVHPLRPVLGREEDLQRLADRFRLGIAQDAPGTIIPTAHPPVRIDEDDRVIPRRVDPGAEQLRGLVHRHDPG